MAKGKYTLLDKIFGPKVTEDDIMRLRFDAFNEGWTDWLELMMTMKDKRRLRMLLAYLRDGIITVDKIALVPPSQPPKVDAYDDDDPWEQRD